MAVPIPRSTIRLARIMTVPIPRSTISPQQQVYLKEMCFIGIFDVYKTLING